MSYLIQALKRLTSSYEDWDGQWIHYSRQPYIKINPKSNWRDPAGIYLFPEKFVTMGDWDGFKYKFLCEVPTDLNILDFGKLTREAMVELVKSLLADINQKLRQEDRNDILTTKYWQSHGWSLIWNTEYMSHRGMFNKNIRKLGYDAIFDDTKSIHPSEVQLIILDPRDVKVIEMTEASGSGFKEVEMVMEHIVKLAEEYGEVTVEKPKLRKGDWGSDPKLVKGMIDIHKSEENYMRISVYPKFPDKRTVGPTAIYVSMTYSKPSVGYGVGAEYEFKKKSFETIDRNLTQAFKKVFSS